MYQLRGSDYSYELFHDKQAGWTIGPTKRDAGIDCVASWITDYLTSGDGCSASPDGVGCAGKWKEMRISARDAPYITVCPSDNPCCGKDCGYGTLSQVGGVNGTTTCTCNCRDGFGGESCSLPPLQPGMAEAYTITGADFTETNGHSYNGRYERLGMECNGKPVYQLAERSTDAGYGWVLHQEQDNTGKGYSDWTVITPLFPNSPIPCVGAGEIWSFPGGGWCPEHPDGAGCAGRWMVMGHCRAYRRTNGAMDCENDWLPAPSLTIERWCPEDNPCCGMDCGAHGALVGGKAGMVSCICTCTGGYTGERCRIPPLQAGMAEAYIITGAQLIWAHYYVNNIKDYNGRYERVDDECNGKPMYQHVGSPMYGEGFVLFQPTNRTCWMVSANDKRCQPKAAISSCQMVSPSNSHGGECAISPDQSGCTGTWQEPTKDCGSGNIWCVAPSLVVTAG